MDRPSCATCAYFERTAEAPGRGQCHEQSPRPDVSRATAHLGHTAGAAWPEVPANQFCGRHPLFEAYVGSLYPPNDLSGVGHRYRPPARVEPPAAAERPAEPAPPRPPEPKAAEPPGPAAPAPKAAEPARPMGPQAQREKAGEPAGGRR